MTDTVVVAPIFYGDELVGWSGSVSHTTETGGIEPGGMRPSALVNRYINLFHKEAEMTKKEYDSFMDNPEGLTDGIIDLVIRELTPQNPRKKYLSKYVRAQICRDPENMPNSDLLWFRWQRGRKYPKPFGIKIIEELGETLPKKETIFRT